MDIISAIHDTRFFRLLFKDLQTWESWLVNLKALFGLELEGKKEVKTFRDCTGFKKSPGQRFKESYVICGRRSGKSYISSIIAVFLATFRDWSKVLSPGEQGYIFIIANDKNQARIIKNYISGILRSSPHFKKLVVKDLTWEVELKNQVSIAVKTCNFRSLRGYTLLACICEELAFWRSEDSANPDKEVITAIKPALATIEDSLLLGISTPYSRRGVLFNQWKKHYAKGGGPLIWRAATEKMNPTIDKALIKDAFESDPAAAASEYAAEFRSDIEAFLSLEMVEAATIPERFELAKIKNRIYYGFADPSGGRQDSFTMGISHQEKSGKVILDVIREIRPPFKPEQVTKEFSDVYKSYKIVRIQADKYAGEWVVDAFKRNGIAVENSKLSKSEIYLSFLPIIANGSVELLDNQRLRSQLTSLERKTRSGGKDAVDNFLGHDDLSNAAAGCCVMANKTKRKFKMTVISRGPDPYEKEPGFWEQFS